MTYFNYERNSGNSDHHHRLDHPQSDRSLSPGHHVQLIEPRTEVEGKQKTTFLHDFDLFIIVTMPIQAAQGSPMSGSLANPSYEAFGGIEIRGDEESTFFSDHPLYGQVRLSS